MHNGWIMLTRQYYDLFLCNILQFSNSTFFRCLSPLPPFTACKDDMRNILLKNFKWTLC